MKILVVDDHALVREGLRQVLKGLDTQVDVLDAPDCARAFELAAQHPDLDLVLLDYHLPDMNGMAALAIFGKKHPELPIVMLSGSVNPKIMRQVMAKGAAGFLTKDGMSQDLLSVLRQVLAGEVVVSADLIVASRLANPASVNGLANVSLALTPRQEEVLFLLLQGCTNREISQKLQLGEETTKTHVSGVFRAFGVKNRIQAVLVAGQHGYPH